MKVSSIFKVILGTLTIIVVSSLIVEMYNTMTYSSQLKSTVTRTITRACDYFARESYKDNDSIPVVGSIYGQSEKAVENKSGIGEVVAYSSPMFDGNSTQSVYDNLYKSGRSSNFHSFITGTITYHGDSTSVRKVTGIWENLDMLAYGLGYGSDVSGLSSNDKSLGNYYYDSKMSPLNLGIAYIDKDTLERIVKWTAIKNLSSSNPERVIVPIGMGKDSLANYVKFNGFRIYYNTFKITSITYDVYDISTSNGLKDLSNTINMNLKNNVDVLDSENYNLKKVCVANIKYDISVSYHGITPFRKIMEYVFNHEVKGMQKGADTTTNNKGYTDNESLSSMNNQNSTIIGSDGKVIWSEPVSGGIKYYIIK